MNNLPFYFVKSLVTNPYLVEGKVYKVEGYDVNSNSILLRNENPKDPFILVDFPMEMFEVYKNKVIQVDFLSKRRVALQEYTGT
jgi:hypothetical protein